MSDPILLPSWVWNVVVACGVVMFLWLTDHDRHGRA